MAENQQNQNSNSQSTIKLYYKKSMTRRQPTDRNYKTLSTGKIIINRNINNQIKMMIRNFRKFN